MPNKDTYIHELATFLASICELEMYRTQQTLCLFKPNNDI